jgi:hypothetical protein
MGYAPVEYIVLMAMCGAIGNHRLLVELALQYMAAFGGWVDLDAPLLAPDGPALPIPELAGAELMARSFEAAEAARIFYSRLPGQAPQITTHGERGARWTTTIADAIFLRAWLDSPQFRLFK